MEPDLGFYLVVELHQERTNELTFKIVLDYGAILTP